MKKKLLLILLIPLLILVTACENNSKVDKKEMQSMELLDYKYGTMTFYYPKKLSFSVETIETENGNALSLISHDYLTNINLFFDYDVNEDYENMINNCKTTKAYREYTWNNKYKGFSCGDENNLSFVAKVYESKIGYTRYLLGNFYMDDNRTGNLITIFNQKNIQEWLNTMEYKK